MLDCAALCWQVTVSGLVPGTTYYYKVWNSHFSTQNSIESRVFTGSTVPCPCGAANANRMDVWTAGIPHMLTHLGVTSADTTMCPQVGDPTKPNGISAVYSFTCPRSLASGPSPYPFDFGMMADLGQTFNSTTTLANLLVRALRTPHPRTRLCRDGQQSTKLSELMQCGSHKLLFIIVL